MAQAKHIHVRLKGPSTVRIDGEKAPAPGLACQFPANVRFEFDAPNLRIEWDAVISGSEYEVRLKQKGASNWITPPVATFTIMLYSPIQQGEEYDFQIRTKCQNGQYSPWSTYAFAVP